MFTWCPQEAVQLRLCLLEASNAEPALLFMLVRAHAHAPARLCPYCGRVHDPNITER